MSKLLYCNLQRKRVALDLVTITADERKADIVACSEPNKIKIANSHWYTDAELDVGIMVRNGLRVTNTGQGSGFVWVTTGETTIFACYISPNVAFDTFFLNREWHTNGCPAA